MEADDLTPVRRTARARKVNPRFVGDDIDESYMKLVGRITASNYSKENHKEGSSGDCLASEEKQMDGELIGADGQETQTPCKMPNGPSVMLCSGKGNLDTGNAVNIAVKTVSLKSLKKCKMPEAVINSSKCKSDLPKSPASIIVRCRSSTESEASVESNEKEEGKRKLVNSLENSIKKIKVNPTGGNYKEMSEPHVDLLSTNLNPSVSLPILDKEISSNALSSPQNSSSFNSIGENPFKNVLKKSFVSFSCKDEKKHPKIVLSSESKLNLTGRKLKIVSLKPISTLKDNLNSDLKPNLSSGKNEVFGGGGPVELKIVKKEMIPLSGSKLPCLPIKRTEEVKAKTPLVKDTKSKGDDSNSNWFSSDGEDDIPLNKLIVKQNTTVKKKKKIQQGPKDSEKKLKVNNSLVKNKTSKKPSDQDDLPLKLLLKKQKMSSKSSSNKIKHLMKKSQNTSFEKGSKTKFLLKKQKMSSKSSSNKIKHLIKKSQNTSLEKGSKNKIKSPQSPGSQTPKVKNVEAKKKKVKLSDSLTKPSLLKTKSSSKGDVKIKKIRTKNLDSKPSGGSTDSDKISLNSNGKIKKVKTKNLQSKVLSLKKKELSFLKKKDKGKKTNKLRFKFPQKKNMTKDVPLANETTNIVISVSGIEGDYACLAIDKDHISTQNTVFKEESKPSTPKTKKQNGSLTPSKKYTFDSGLVLEEDLNVVKTQPIGPSKESKLIVREKELSELSKKAKETETKEKRSSGPMIKTIEHVESDLMVKEFSGTVKKTLESSEIVKNLKEPSETVKKIKESIGMPKKTKESSETIKNVKDTSGTVKNIKEVSGAIKKEKDHGEITKKVKDFSEPTQQANDSSGITKKLKDNSETTKKSKSEKLDDNSNTIKKSKDGIEIGKKIKEAPEINKVGDRSESAQLSFHKEESEKYLSESKRISEGKSKPKSKPIKIEDKDVCSNNVKIGTLGAATPLKDFPNDLSVDNSANVNIKHEAKLTDTVNKELPESKKNKEKRSKDELFKREKHGEKSKSKVKDKKHRQSKLAEKLGMGNKSSSVFGIKHEEKSIKKERNSSKDQQSPKKPEKDNTKSSSSHKKIDKESKNDSISRNLEREMSKENLPGTLLSNKVKKKENFEEALLNIPMPKLSSSKHKSDSTKSSDRKKEKDEALKKSHKESKLETSDSSGKNKDQFKDASKLKESHGTPLKEAIKPEFASKEIKKEVKSRHREDKKHSSKSEERRRSHSDSKDGIKKDFAMSLFFEDKPQKRKIEEKERSRHSSHKKHKKDHRSESHHRKKHSSEDRRSKDCKKENLEEVSKTKEGENSGERKPSVKNEDMKDIIVNRIVDGIEKGSPEHIKQEALGKSPSSLDKLKSSESTLPLPTKKEIKPELLIDEEYLINTNRMEMKEEKEISKVSDVEVAAMEISRESRSSPPCVKTESSIQSLTESPKVSKQLSLTSLKKEGVHIGNEKEVNKVSEELKNSDITLDVSSDSLKHSSNLPRIPSIDSPRTSLVINKFESEGDASLINIDSVEDYPSKISGEDASYQNIKNKEENSDLGILDELQKLEQEGTLSKKPRALEREVEYLSPAASFESSMKPSLCSFEEKRLTPLEASGKEDIQMSNSKSLDEMEKDAKEMLKDDENLQPFNYISESEQEQEIDREVKTSLEQKYAPEDTPYSSSSSREVNEVSRASEERKDVKMEDAHLVHSGESLGQLSAEEINKPSSPSVDQKPEPFIFPTPLNLIPLPEEALSKKGKDVSTPPLQSLKKGSPSFMVTSSPLCASSPLRISSPVTKSTDDEVEITSDEKENIVPDEDLMEISPPPPSSSLEEKGLKEEKEVIKELTPEEIRERELRNKQIVEERMKTFEVLEENLYLSERVKSKRSKDAKRMVCDCSLSKEELTNNEMGCGDDCINRLLMIECGSRCPLKEQCMNKNFQRRNYAPVEVFNAEEKGCGVRACQDIPAGSFIMEYVGEVFDTREFKRRRREYAKGSSAHFYFMALRSDRLIDATLKGNISRFINHSCCPNAETQKWTVNGDVRIGFFATENISAGEEINFDYRLERYGREPQKCFCGTPQCRGWLGEPPDQKTKEEKEEDRRRQIKDRQRREGKRAIFEDMDLDDEIEKLRARGLRNKQDTLTLSRLMVRCEDADSRLVLLKILGSGEEASRRLFLDYHGLKLLWSWMVDISSSHKCNTLKVEILKTLSCLPITNRTQVTDSKILSVVERWSKTEKKEEDSTTSGDTEKASSPPAPPRPSQERKTSDGSEDSEDAEMSESKSRSGEVNTNAASATNLVEDSSSPEDSNELPISSVSVPPVSQQSEGEGEIKSPSGTDDGRSSDTEKNLENDVEEVRSLATQLLQVWRALKEAFRIPKKERIEMMKEHERAVEKEYAEFLHSERHMDSEDRTQAFYDRWRYSSSDREKQRERERRREKWRSRRREDDEEKGLSKEERRERFAMQVAKEDEEARQRKLQEEMWTLHLERCALLEHDPYYTPIFDPSGQYYWDPGSKAWEPYIGPSGNLPVPASYGMTPNSSIENVVPTGPSLSQSFLPGAFYPLPNDTPEAQPGVVAEGDALNLDPASIPLPGETVSSESPAESPIKSAAPLSQEGMDITIEPVNGIDTPPLAPPGPVTIILPSQWKLARDGDRRIYFYHIKTRHTQWELPQENQHQVLMAQYGLDSDSESDLESDSDSSSSSDSEDFSSDEEEEEEEEEPTEVPAVQATESFDEKMLRRPKGKKVRSEKLVQERVISPILFEDREAARRERKEAKERAREEARKERWQLLRALKGITTSTGSSTGKGESDFGFVPISEDTVVSPNDNDEDDEHLEEQLTRFSRKQKSEGKSSHTKGKSKERAATAMADTSDLARKIKDNFRSRMATYIVSVLNPYRKPDCTEGRITSNEDFKYLARKLTHFVMVKELKQLPSIDGLDCSESVKHKTKEFVRKYMGKYGNTFKRDPNDTKEY